MSPEVSDKISNAYIHERRKLLGYIRNRVPAAVEAEDILHDVFYQITLGFRDLERIQNLTAWLYKVTDNRITDLFRKKRHEKVSYTETAAFCGEEPLTLQDILPEKSLLPEDREINNMIWNTIEEVLDDLPEEQRDVFIANEFEDKSFKEISETTGVGVNTLISRKRYAVLALRERLDELYRLIKNK